MSPTGSARLIEEIPAQRAVATIVSRAEITDALDEDGVRPELLLQIAQEGGDGREERSTISMTWSREDLETLLQGAKSDEVILTFDRDELSQAVGDVEAHGLRERALVFAVAAAGALGTGATIANAMPTGDAGGSVVQSSALMLTDASSGGGYVASEPVSDSSSMLTDASSGSGYVASEPVSDSSSMLTDASSGSGYVASEPVSDSSSMLTDASSGSGYGPAATSGSSGGLAGIDVPAPIDGLIAGGIALAIAGAAFVSRRPERARPA